MRALVTGASGFVGRHLLDALRERRWQAVATSRRYSQSGSAEFVAGDVADGRFVLELLRSGEFDVVFHLAGRDAFSAPPELYAANVVVTATLLDAVRQVGRRKPRVVLLGSSAQYGAAGDEPIREDAGMRPVTDYGISKVACEMMGRLLFEQTAQPVLCARAFNIVGPGQSARLLQGAVIEQIVAIEEGRQPAVVGLGDLSAYRDFVDVRDVARGLVAVAEFGEAGEAYNLCSGQAVQVSDFVDRLVALADVPIRVNSRGLQGGANVPFQTGSYQKLRRQADWMPATPLEKSLRDALAESRRRVSSAAAEHPAGDEQR